MQCRLTTEILLLYFYYFYLHNFFTYRDTVTYLIGGLSNTVYHIKSLANKVPTNTKKASEIIKSFSNRMQDFINTKIVSSRDIITEKVKLVDKFVYCFHC